MTSVPDKIAEAAWSVVPAPLERKLRTEAGTRFLRFILVAAAAVITSQVVLGLLTGPVNLSAGTSGVIASMVARERSFSGKLRNPPRNWPHDKFRILSRAHYSVMLPCPGGEIK